jgi:hypothetical protein
MCADSGPSPRSTGQSGDRSNSLRSSTLWRGSSPSRTRNAGISNAVCEQRSSAELRRSLRQHAAQSILTKSPDPRSSILALRSMFSVRSARRSSRAGPHRQPGTKPSPVSAVRSRDYAAFLNCSNRSANRSRSGRSLLRRGSWISCPTIPFRPSSRNGPSWISSSRSETWMRKFGSMPIR